MTARAYLGRLMVVASLAPLAFGPSDARAAQATYSLTRPAGEAAAPTPAPATAATTARGSPAAAPLKPEELEQLVASIALYPDSLLAQVLMASTYPLEVVQADRWVKQNPTLKGSADALNKLTWDPSVKSLIDFPQVLTMMSEKLDWTVKLGDAFIADQKAVMDAVQRLRGKAYAGGNLKSSSEQTVKVEPAPAAPAGDGAAPAAQVIVVESSSPSTVYVPTYNPAVVYGAWPYPSYPPYYYYPPGYVAGTAMISFGIGVACGAAWGHAWGDCDWHGGDVEVDIDQNVNFNGNIDREQYKAERDARQTERQGSQDARQTDRQGNQDARQGSRDARQTDRQGGRSNSFQHDPSHRQGVAYRDSATSERFRGSGASQMTTQSRDAYRGRAEAGRQDLSRGSADAYRGGSGSAGLRTGAGDGAYRSGGASGARQPSASPRDYSGTRSNGFSGSNSSSSSARAASNRGQSSRSSSSYSPSRSGGGGGYRGGGGGGRGGGGGGRGGGGGGRGGGGRR